MILAADPVSVSKPAAKSKVYLVYVTVVEVDEEGNETILFTPKVQTTGNPAGVTVEHVDGRTFDFNCKLTRGAPSGLEQPGTVQVTGKPNRPSATKPAAGGTAPALVPATEARPIAEASKPAPSVAAAVPNQPSRGADEYFVRTYDVSDLLEQTENLADADFAPLMQTLKAIAVPESWTGKATIRSFPSTKSLVIKQNEAGHKAVVSALAELRPRSLDTP